MTTVAYNHKDGQICVDGRLIVNDTIVCDDYRKFIQDGDCLFFFCGRVCDYQKIVDCYNGDKINDIDAASIMIRNGEAFHCTVNRDGNIELVKLTYNASIGRGDEVALTAMDFGATAKQAVKHASKRTTSTGGRLRVYDLKLGKFI